MSCFLFWWRQLTAFRADVSLFPDLECEVFSLPAFCVVCPCAVYAFDGSSVVTSRIYPLPVVEERPSSVQTPKHSAEAGSPGHVQMGAWGYQVSAKWGPGHVKVKAEVHELGSCWIEGDRD
eukprot:scaffold128728_cov19-Tisochrysis_lutea.AAC.3